MAVSTSASLSLKLPIKCQHISSGTLYLVQSCITNHKYVLSEAFKIGGYKFHPYT